MSDLEPRDPERSFASQAQDDEPGLLRDFWDYLCYNKKWWLAPIFIVLLVIGGLLILAASGAAPFIYTLF